MDMKQASANAERVVRVHNGWIMLPVLIGLLVADVVLLIFAIQDGAQTMGQLQTAFVVGSVLLLPVCAILLKGFFTLQPNEARVLVLFGGYKGTVRTSGFHWGNPFYTNGSQMNGALAQNGGIQARLAGRKLDTGAGVRHDCVRNKISLRARTLNGEKLKEIDKRGKPIEIAAVVVWRVEDTAHAAFDD